MKAISFVGALLISLLILAAGESFAESQVVIYFTYDDQDITEYEIDILSLRVGLATLCSDDDPVIDSNGHYQYACSGVDLDPGTYDMYLVVTDMTGEEIPSDIETVVIPEPEPELPERLHPVITGHEVNEV